MLLENCTYREDNRVRREASTLIEAGYRVTVICPHSSKYPWSEVVDGVRVYGYPPAAESEGALGYVDEYLRAMGYAFVLSLLVFFSDGFDVVHAHNPPDTFVFIGLFYKLFGKKFIFDHHDLNPEMYYARFQGKGNRLVHRALVWLEQLSCRAADRVIATNQSYKALEIERSGIPESRITIVRNGPNLKRVRLVDPDPELRQMGKTILGYVGVMGYQDGVDYFIRALHHLVYEMGRTNVYAVLVGTGGAWKDLQKLAIELKLEPYVRFTGMVSDEELMCYLSSADVCIGPDPKNNFTDRSTMIKLMEFMALGKPIVAFDLTEHRYTLQDAALYAVPNDERDFARQIARLMDDPNLRQQLGQIGRERIQHTLAWPHQAHHLLEAYEKVFAN
ncbi:MAG: glycosyltransferase family 4 protein [Chloroflexaceae bacterium]|nr:glycosyltransferase family 4 protein [Chloroflexaceae bacterium]NJO05062.1 glycosyltransferase family 4 protein [Chloroflexaceae bacterium]